LANHIAAIELDLQAFCPREVGHDLDPIEVAALGRGVEALEQAHGELREVMASIFGASSEVEGIADFLDTASDFLEVVGSAASAVESACSAVDSTIKFIGLDTVLDAIDEYIDEILEWTGIDAAIESLSEEIDAQLEPMIEEMIRIALQSEAIADALYNLPEISSRILVALDQLEQKGSGDP